MRPDNSSSPTRFTAAGLQNIKYFPTFANANAIAIEQLKLENEGWERDQSVREPVEPSSRKP